MEGVVPSKAGTKATISEWIGRHPGIVPLIVALALGFFLPPALIAGLKQYDIPVKVGQQQLSLTHLIWLGFSMVLGIVVLWARSKISRDLTQATRQVLAGAAQNAGWGAVDAPGIGAGLVRGLFNLVILLVIQSMLRPPLVAVGSAYAPKAWLDGGVVLLVAAIALGMLFGLHRVSRPLIERLLWIGLDQIMPTAGYETRTVSVPLPTRTLSSRPAPPAPRRPAEPTVAAGTPAEATVAAQPSSAEATVPALAVPTAMVADATVLAPQARAAMPADVTMAAPPLTPPAPARAQSPGASSPPSADATILAPVPEESQPPARVAEATIISPPLPCSGDEAPVMDVPSPPRPQYAPPLGEPATSFGAEATIAAGPAIEPEMAAPPSEPVVSEGTAIEDAIPPAEETLQPVEHVLAAEARVVELSEVPEGTAPEQEQEPSPPLPAVAAEEEEREPMVTAAAPAAEGTLPTEPVTGSEPAPIPLPETAPESSPVPGPLRWSARRFGPAPAQPIPPSRKPEVAPLPAPKPEPAKAPRTSPQIRWSDRTFISPPEPQPEQPAAAAPPTMVDETMAPAPAGADQTMITGDDLPAESPPGAAPEAGNGRKPADAAPAPASGG